MHDIEMQPNAARVMEGLRDTGYDFNTALADIIDNSIAADANNVDVVVDMDFAGDICISIADDGIGMDGEGLMQAMRYGSPPRPDPSSLGKFGLGLKTASTAFCRRLSVISRADGNEPLRRATWDLDHVADTGRWMLQCDEADDKFVQELEKTAGSGSGTLVVWDSVDRVLDKDYENPGGGWAQRALDRKVNSLREHVAQTYQRFLDPNDTRARTLELTINGTPVEAWNPFDAVGGSKLVADENIEVVIDGGGRSRFLIRAFVLPHKNEMTSEEQRVAKISNKRQGIYVYRENRLIHGPDWLELYSKEPHLSLLRIEFSFDHTMDQAFKVDIKKSRILLSEELFKWLKDEFIGPPRRAANERYRRKTNERTRERAKSAHDASNNAIASQQTTIGGGEVEVVDDSAGEISITAPDGSKTTKKGIKILTPRKPGEVHVAAVESIDDGLLWEPALIDRQRAVRLNTGHPYYHKVYVPNLSEGVTVQGMDSLLWALSAAELNATGIDVQRVFQEVRFEVTRLLRHLVSELPEPADQDLE